MQNKENDLRIWWIPQVPMEPFRHSVKNVAEAKNLLNALALYDIFQFEHKVKPDFCNMGGLEIFLEGEWNEWCDDDTGESIEEKEIDD